MSEDTRNKVPAVSRRAAVGTVLLGTGALLASRTASAAATNNTIHAAAHGVQADGVTNDAAALLSAIAAMSNGSVLILPAGVIALGSVGWTGIAINGLTNITIQGNATSLKWLARPTQKTGGAWFTGFRLVNCVRAVVSDLSINGNGIDCAGLGLDTCSDSLVVRVEAFAHGTASPTGLGQFVSASGNRNTWAFCTARNATPGSQFRGFWLGNPNAGYAETDLTVESCKALSNDGTGIGMQGVRALCANSRSNGNNGAGIVSATSLNNPSSDHVIIGNLCRQNAFHGYQTDVWGPNALRIGVVGNNFSDNTNSGVYCNKGTEVTVTGNTLSNNGATTGSSAVVINNSNHVKIADNVIEGDQTYGRCISLAYPANACADIVISGNTCIGSATRTINLEAVDSTSAFRRVMVSANIVTGGSHGIYLRTAQSGSTIEDITIAENLIHSATVANYYVADNALGQTKNLRLIGNGGGSASISANVLPASNVHNAWNAITTFRASAPTSGTWNVGDMVYNTVPVASGFIGWVCVSAGIPGVWKGFGSIAP